MVVFGPTAVGKTEVAIALAKYFHTEILSADSRQFYRELNIGVAKPNAEQLATVPHHFVGHLSIQDDYSAGDYERDAIELLEKVFTTHPVAFLVGGSGLFIKVVLEGLDTFPGVGEKVNRKLAKILEDEGIEGLQKLLKEHDPDHYEKVDRSNPQRLMRALGVTLSSGKPYSSFRKSNPKSRDFEVVKIGLNLPRETLYARIDERVDEMIRRGLVEEAKQLLPFREKKSLQTVGYTELFDFLEGKIPLEESINLVKQHTRNFAKRQITWFRKEKDVQWFSPGEVDRMIECISGKI